LVHSSFILRHPRAAQNLSRVKANRVFADFARRLKESQDIFQPWKGTIYRVSTLKYGGARSFLFGEGSYRYGGRWNSPGSFRAVYGSVDVVTALKESEANAAYANLPYPFRETRLIVALEVSLARVLDLSSPDTLSLLGVSKEELQKEDWRKVQEQGFESLTQALGRAAFNAKGEGLRTLSARVPKAVNVAYFPQNRLRGSTFRLWERQELRAWGLD
jgi:RES domain-containing protein